MRKSELIANCRTMEKKYGIATAEYVVGAGSALLVLGLREETDDIDAACGQLAAENDPRAGRQKPGRLPILS